MVNNVYKQDRETYQDKIEDMEQRVGRPLRITEKLMLLLTFMEEDLWGEENEEEGFQQW